MSKNLSRRDFLKGAVAGMAGVATMGVLSACGADDSKATPTPEAKGLYTPGTYSAKATGMAEIEVTMTFDANSITNLELSLPGETPDIGQAAGDKLKQAILDAQSADIDAVAGATVTTNAVKEAAKARGRAWRSRSPIPPPARPRTGTTGWVRSPRSATSPRPRTLTW